MSGIETLTHCVQTDPAKNVWTRAYLIPERNRTGRRQEEGKNSVYLFVFCRILIVKLSEIRGWDQADRHFATHYRLFLN
jgi:hypothetical protein